MNISLLPVRAGRSERSERTRVKDSKERIAGFIKRRFDTDVKNQARAENMSVGYS